MPAGLGVAGLGELRTTSRGFRTPRGASRVTSDSGSPALFRIIEEANSWGDSHGAWPNSPLTATKILIWVSWSGFLGQMGPVGQ